ncbi:MAG: Hint domain-containing protein [Pseudomonadota bacterium]
MNMTPSTTRMGAYNGNSMSLLDHASPQDRRATLGSYPTRNIEIACLRADHTLMFETVKVPRIQVFEEAAGAFAQGTLLLTDTGEIAIEDLQPGDRVATSIGTTARVLWIGSSSFAPPRVSATRTPLLRIMDDAFGSGQPGRYLTVGPNARLLHTPPHLRGQFGETPLMTPVGEFVDGVNVIEVTPPTPVRLFQLVLDRHAAIKANGLLFETFHPGLQAFSGQPYAMRELFMSMFPHLTHFADFGPLAHPRAPASDQKLSNVG